MIKGQDHKGGITVNTKAVLAFLNWQHSLTEIKNNGCPKCGGKGENKKTIYNATESRYDTICLSCGEVILSLED